MTDTFTQKIAGAATGAAPVVGIKETVGAAGGGGTITLTERIGTPPAAPEEIVKSFVEQFKDRRDQRLEQIRNPPGATETASVCWGKAPALQQSTTKPPSVGDRVVVRDATDKPKNPDDNNKEITFREIERKTKKIKVASEDDPNVFVMVERVDVWIANGSDGKRYRFEFKNKTK